MKHNSIPPCSPTVLPLMNTQYPSQKDIASTTGSFPLKKRCCGLFMHCCYWGWGCRTPFALLGTVLLPAHGPTSACTLPHPEPQGSFMCSKWSLASPTEFGCGPSSAKTSWGACKTWAANCLYLAWLSQRLWLLRMLLACLSVDQILSSSLL